MYGIKLQYYLSGLEMPRAVMCSCGRVYCYFLYMYSLFIPLRINDSLNGISSVFLRFFRGGWRRHHTAANIR